MLPGHPVIQASEAHRYTDLASLARLRSDARRDAGATLDEVAEQFESIFMQMMMKSMRKAGFGDPLLGSKAVEFYQGMLDDQLSVDLSANGSLGIAEMLKRQLRPLVAGEEKAPAATTGALPPPERLSSYRWSAPVESAPVESTSERESQVSPTAAFADRAAFVEHLRPAATRAAARLGVPAELLLAQAALETGWGRSVMRNPDGTSSHNLFGIKADARWDGPRVTVATLEYGDGVARREQASFRSYDSFAESFDDYVDFLTSGTRYAPALERADDPESFMRTLHESGYATDPRYADKVLRIWREDMART